MPDKPVAEVVIDETRVRDLLAAQAPAFAGGRLEWSNDGWDCSVWRLGTDTDTGTSTGTGTGAGAGAGAEELAVRVPRRAAAAPLVRHEQRWVPVLAELVAPSGLSLPTPLFAGSPTDTFPWPWSIVPWFAGTNAIAVPRPQRTPWAPRLAEALARLHTPAHPEAPRNPFRGVPLVERAETVSARVEAGSASVTPETMRALAVAWGAGLSTEPWSAPPVWIHGDLHPGNLIARDSELVALIDFGDVTAGDPAYDLAVAWLAFDAAGRSVFQVASPHVDAATWTRARAWAAAVALILLQQSDDNPDYLALGIETADEVAKSAAE